MSGESILCVDDDVHVQRLLKRMLATGGYQSASAGSVDEARQLLDAAPVRARPLRHQPARRGRVSCCSTSSPIWRPGWRR